VTGSVREIAIENSRNTILLQIIRLRLAYDGATSAPATLILKTGLPGDSNPTPAILKSHSIKGSVR
jgi:hypothetical protein